MRQIDVAQAQVGDVIAAPLINDEGRVLLPKGAKLSPAVLSRLAGWGVQSIQLEGDDPGAESDDAVVTGGSGTDEIEHRFAEWGTDDLMMAIKQIALRHAKAG